MLNIIKPTLVLDSKICRNNIRNMAAKAARSKVIFRPHFKTHQSAIIGEWFREEGVRAIAVSSVSMALYFAENGWADITIAFPVNILEMEDINSLASKITLNLLLESEETTEFLKNKLTHACGFFLKIDTGYHRTGIEASNLQLIDRILETAASSKLHFKGFLTHSGHTYHAADRNEIIRIQEYTAEILLQLKKHYLTRFPDIIISVGDTPSCSQLSPIQGTDEIRPGNFVFFDMMQSALGSCTPKEIAVAVICPVVALHHERKEAVIYGGAVHLSKEQGKHPPDPAPYYGLAVGWDGKNWDTGNILGKVSVLSQEHGLISLTDTGVKLKPGDLAAILPVHSCLTVNLMRRYYSNNGDIIEVMQGL